MTTTTDEVQQTLAEYERLAITSGAKVQIEAPEFARMPEIEGRFIDWMPIWAGEEPPDFARARVYRDDVPTTVYVSWAESLPAVDEWRDLWLRKPMKLFGAYTLRTALRRAFRDVIGDRHEPDEIDPPLSAPDADRDWSAELAEAQTVEAVDALHAEMKRARVVTVDLEQSLRRRRVEVGAKLATGGVVTTPAGPIGEVAHAAVMPRPRPSVPTIRPADTVKQRPQRKPDGGLHQTVGEATNLRPKGERRPQKPKPRGPRA